MNLDERDAVATQFGVAAEQVERDHLISHLLAFLSRQFGDRIQFIGGTALARTHLPDGRLSEDIDLIALGDRKQVALDLDVALPRSVARSHGRLTVEPELSWTADTLPVLLRPADGRPVRLQLLSSRDRILWPTEHRALVQLRRRATRRAFGTHPARVRRIEDRDMGRSTRRPRPLGPMGAQRDRGHRPRRGRVVQTLRPHQQEPGGISISHRAIGRGLARPAGATDPSDGRGEGSPRRSAHRLA